MHRLAGEAVDTWNIWPLRLVELSNSADKKVTRDGVLLLEFRFLRTSGLRYTDTPFLGIIIPPCFIYGAVETDVLEEIVLLSHADQIRENFFLSRIFARPFTK